MSGLIRMDRRVEQEPQGDRFAKIKVVGIGGGGSNAVNRMMQAGVPGVEFIALNTDAQALHRVQAHQLLPLGDKLTKGLGCGGNPVLGAKAAEESSELIYELIKESDMVFLTAGMGGGTGSGATPVIAQLCQQLGALTVAVVTTPFTFEGPRRRTVANDAIEQLRDKVDSLIAIPNDRLLEVVDKKVSIEDAFRTADDVLRQGIQGISSLITEPGLINLDFADVRSVMAQAGTALMAIGHGSGDNRALDAARAAVSSPLLDLAIDGAKGVLFNVSGGPDLTLHEVYAAAEVVYKAADPNANVIFGVVIDPEGDSDVTITLIATGFAAKPGAAKRPTAQPAAQPTKLQYEATLPQFQSDEVDVPAFLRMREQHG